MYKCEICGTEFDKPETIRHTEIHDGENGWETQHIPVCPICKNEYFEEIQEVPEVGVPVHIPSDAELQHIYYSSDEWPMCFDFSGFRNYYLENLKERERNRQELLKQ